MFSMILFLVTCHLAYACVQWSTRNRVVQWVGSMAYSLPMFFLIRANLSPTLQVEFSLVENVVMIMVCVASIALAVAGIKRQRRGDAVASELQPKTAVGGYPDLLLRFFPFRCPTSSATRAQLWFEFKSSGMPVLTIGLGISLLVWLLFAISVPVAPVRDFALGIAFFSVPIVLFALGNNAFGIRRKQGRTYASSFEMTQPYGTAQLAGLKTFVRTACVLTASLALGASLWASSSLIGAWGEWQPIAVNKDAVPGLLEMREEFAETFGGLTGLAFAALAVVAAINIATLVNWQAAREALRVRYPRRLYVVQWLPAVLGFVVVLMALADRKGIVSDGTARSFFMATFWVTGAAMLIAAIYFLCNGIATRVLTIRYILGALAIAAIFGVAWRVGIAAGNVFGISWLALGILMVIVLAPWALSRVRHA
jgi:hypothetical protein